ncbi:helix-turn-helix domain-containing protein [Streptomyces sp. NBC_00555]|uniref:NACHT domain-containing protein n=1 Tax=Streptomyces sp. NBC_00555 TaxID=2903662 RepID=UPI00224D687C|nr:helix-turn-helix domain-containing protein [Streptomyces sp. NBC_00555]MCX5009981.1 helix-turn-helix domain-containing protein [Streptomyces sp. NBC_00555]
MEGLSTEVPGGAHRELIARIRTALAGRKQSEVARDAGIQPSTLSNILNAKAVPTLTTLDVLARALGITGPALVELRRLRERADVRTRRIDGYLAAARDAAREHPYAGVLPGTTPPLAAVYLRQRVRRAAEAAGAATVPADEVPAGGRVCVILAGPGGGKSSLLRTWLARGTGRWLKGRGEESVPVLVPAADLVDAPLADALAASVNRELEGLVEKLPAAFFGSEPQPGAGWLVLVDGLDEVTDAAARHKVLRRLADASGGEHAGLYRFIVATRPLPGRELDLLGTDVPHYALQPFGRDDLPLIAGNWFRCLEVADPEGTTRRFLRALEQTRLAALAQVPLMTAMLCQLHAAAPDQPLPAGRGQLYREFVDLLHRQQHRAGSHGLPVLTAGLGRYGPGALAAAEEALDHLPELIARLAAERQAGNTRPALDVLCEQPRARRPARVPEGDWRAFLDTAARRGGLLIPRGGDLVFLHQTLLEHLAARHVLRDPKEGARAIRRAFHQPRRCRPAFPMSVYATGTPPGVRPRAWGLRYWAPPADSSSTGFLLDAAHDAGLGLRRSPLRRLASRGGLPGWEFVAAQAHMGTRLPDDVVAKAVGHLHAYTGPEFSAPIRTQAAEALTRLGDPRGPDLLYGFAVDASCPEFDRFRVAGALVEHGDPRGPAWLFVVSGDPAVSSKVRRDAAAALAAIGDPRAAGQFLAIALARSSSGRDRVPAAESAAELGDPRALDALYALCLAPDMPAAYRVAAAEALATRGDPRGPASLLSVSLEVNVQQAVRVRAAGALVSAGDPRGADRLHALGLSSGGPGQARLEAGVALAGIGDPRAAEVFHSLAANRGEGQHDRIRAAKQLAALGDPRSHGLLLALSRDPGISGSPRVEAATALAALDEPAAAEQLHALTWARALSTRDQLAAAVALAGLGDRRAAHALHLLALCPEVPDPSRVNAARALVGLGDPHAAGLLRALPALLDPNTFGDYLLDVPRLLAGLGDARAAELLAALPAPLWPGEQTSNLVRGILEEVGRPPRGSRPRRGSRRTGRRTGPRSPST